MTVVAAARPAKALAWLCCFYAAVGMLLWTSVNTGLFDAVCGNGRAVLTWLWPAVLLSASGFVTWRVLALADSSLDRRKALIGAIQIKGMALVVVAVAVVTGQLQAWPMLFAVGFIACVLQILFFGICDHINKAVLILVLWFENTAFAAALTLPVWLLSLCSE